MSWFYGRIENTDWNNRSGKEAEREREDDGVDKWT